MFRKLTSGVALLTTLSLSLSGLIFSPAHADVPADGSYSCSTGVKDGAATRYTITSGVVENGGSCAGAVVVPEGVTSFGADAFRDAASLISINIPSTVTSLEVGSFRNATALTSITIPASVTSIGQQAFSRTFALTSVSIAEGSQLTNIGLGAFYLSTAITSITIPASVTSIGNYAFENASALKDVYFLGNAPTNVGSDVFDSVATGAKAHISATATGFGDESTWNRLVIDRALPNYTVTYNVANGTAITSESVTQGSSIQTAPVSTRTGYTLSGWSTSANGSIVKFPYPVTSDITLYAIWTQTKTPPKSVTKTATTSYAAQFPAGSSVITKSTESAIKKMVSKSGKSATFTVTGVATKATGVPDSYVKGLAKARAEKVKAYLVKLGVKKSNISIKTRILESGISPKTKILAKYVTK